MRNVKLYDGYCAICGAPVSLGANGHRCEECGQIYCEHHIGDEDDGCDGHRALT